MTITTGSSNNNNRYYHKPENHPRGVKRLSSSHTTSSSKRQKISSSPRSGEAKVKDIPIELLFQQLARMQTENGKYDLNRLESQNNTNRNVRPVNRQNVSSSSNQQSRMIDSLPVQILWKIFTHVKGNDGKYDIDSLKNLSKTCKHFREILSTEKIKVFAAENFHPLKKLNVNPSNIRQNVTAASNFAKEYKLRNVNLQGFYLTNQGLRNLVKENETIRNLKIEIDKGIEIRDLPRSVESLEIKVKDGKYIRYVTITSLPHRLRKLVIKGSRYRQLELKLPANPPPYLENVKIEGFSLIGVENRHNLLNWFNERSQKSKGKYYFPDGSTYTGKLEGGKPHGSGQLHDFDGNLLYEGSWQNGVPHGVGQLIFTYRGRRGLSNNNRFFENSYTGGFDSRPTGNGHVTIYSKEHGVPVYEGEWQNFKYHGKGRLSFSNGSWSEGRFQNDQFLGVGKRKIVYQNGGSYEGDVLGNLPDGKGRARYGNGSCYEGEFKKGKRHGWGRYSFSNGSWSEGKFQNDQFLGVGKGKIVYQNGGSYEGEVLGNLPDGKGRARYGNGSCYEGEFKKGKRHGEGVYHYENDTNRGKYEGMYKNGKRNGFGREYDQKGELIASVYWEEGVLKPRLYLSYSSGYEPELSDGDCFIPSYEDLLHSDHDNDSTNNIHHVRYGLNLAPEQDM